MALGKQAKVEESAIFGNVRNEKPAVSWERTHGHPYSYRAPVTWENGHRHLDKLEMRD